MSNETYEEWKHQAHEQCKSEHCHWAELDGWLYPTRSNGAWYGKLAHLCEERHSNTTNQLKYSLYGCGFCGEEVPDGIKMIALLEF